MALDKMTGQRIWRIDLPDGVMNRAVVNDANLFVTCRDGNLYSLDRLTGKIHWQMPLGSPSISVPSLAEDRVYAQGIEGRVSCFEQSTGKEIWRFDLATKTGTRPQLLSSPLVIIDKSKGNRLLVSTELKTNGRSAAVLYCLQERTSSP